PPYSQTITQISQKPGRDLHLGARDCCLVRGASKRLSSFWTCVVRLAHVGWLFGIELKSAAAVNESAFPALLHLSRFSAFDEAVRLVIPVLACVVQANRIG